MSLADILPHARRELAAREQAAGATEQTGQWRRIVALCEGNRVELPDGIRPAAAWTAMLSVAHAALEQRVEQCARKPSTDLQSRICALRHLRDHLMRAAIRAGADLPSFDQPEKASEAA